MSGHQHEEWQMLESAKGGRYCGACGEHEEVARQVSPDEAVEEHGMIPGSHERPGGAECRCGAPWSRWSDLCLVQFKRGAK